MSLLKEKYWDMWAGVFLFLFSIVLYIGAMNVRMLDVSRLGSGFFPKILAVMLATTSVIIFLGGVKKSKSYVKKEGTPMRWQGVLFTFSLMLAYMITIPFLGFMISTAIYLFIQMNILSANHNRRLVLFAVISVITSVLIYFTFVKVFNLMLPAGILG